MSELGTPVIGQLINDHGRSDEVGTRLLDHRLRSERLASGLKPVIHQQDTVAGTARGGS